MADVKKFKLPDPGEGIHEAEILEVHVGQGDSVSEGEPLLTVETDKASVEVPSPFTGTVEEVRIEVGDQVRVGDVLLTYREGGAAEPAREKKDEEKKRREAKQPEESEEEEEEKAEKQAAMKPEDEERRRPQRGARESRPWPEDRPVPASPATRRRARELDIDLHDVPGSGPGGRVTKEDVEALAEDETAARGEGEKLEKKRERKEKRKPMAAREGAAAFELPDFSRFGPTERWPIRSIRRRTAERMALAWSRIPHVMHQDVADITELEAFRQEQSDTVLEAGGKLTLTVLVMKAVASALKNFPRFNASLDEETDEIVVKGYHHLGVAVETENGLLVPVVRDVDCKSIVELAVEVTKLAERARKGELERGDMQGGSFTITNPGGIGGTSFTPIINFPEVAILGVGRAYLGKVIEGSIEDSTERTRLCLPLCLAFDHRVNDGADAARFARTLVKLLEDPGSLVLSA